MKVFAAASSALAAVVSLLFHFAIPSASAQSCTGEACGDVKLVRIGSCVWAESESKQPVTVTVQVAQEKIVLPLEAADLTKSKPMANSSSGGTAEEARQRSDCVSVMNTVKMLEDMRARGMNIPGTEADGKAAFCRKLLAPPSQSNASPVATGVHTRFYDSFSQREMPRYRARLSSGSSCVAFPSDVSSYTANYGPAVQKPAGQ